MGKNLPLPDTPGVWRRLRPQLPPPHLDETVFCYMYCYVLTQSSNYRQGTECTLPQQTLKTFTLHSTLSRTTVSRRQRTTRRDGCWLKFFMSRYFLLVRCKANCRCKSCASLNKVCKTLKSPHFIFLHMNAVMKPRRQKDRHEK